MQTEALFPGHYTSACHLCYSWNCCLILIIHVRLRQLFPLLAFRLPAIPVVHERGVNRVFSAEYLDTFALDRNKYGRSPACPSYALAHVRCFHSGTCVGAAWLPLPLLPEGWRCYCRHHNMPWHSAAVGGSFKGRKMFEN